MQIKNLQYRKNSTNTAVACFAVFLLIITPGRAHNSQDCELIRPFDSLKMLIKTKKNIPFGMFFLFGTPIGNRTLVSAVRGRRLEPLDHEGKSILLCDNIIILPVTQAKIYIFSQKTSCVVYDSSHFCVFVAVLARNVQIQS